MSDIGERIKKAFGLPLRVQPHSSLLERDDAATWGTGVLGILEDDSPTFIAGVNDWVVEVNPTQFAKYPQWSIPATSLERATLIVEAVNGYAARDAALTALLAACEVAMAQCGELCQGYDGWQTQMREAVAKAKEVMG